LIEDIAFYFVSYYPVLTKDVDHSALVRAIKYFLQVSSDIESCPNSTRAFYDRLAFNIAIMPVAN